MNEEEKQNFIIVRGEKVFGTKEELDAIRKRVKEELSKPEICGCGSGLEKTCDCGCAECARCNDDEEFDLFD